MLKGFSEPVSCLCYTELLQQRAKTRIVRQNKNKQRPDLNWCTPLGKNIVLSLFAFAMTVVGQVIYLLPPSK